jgi:predicted TIM-barrel fold metal-dependent hydrolase
MAEKIGIQRMIVVQASIYAPINAITQFGLHRARGVVIIDDNFDQSALQRLHQQGVRGVWFNMNGTPVERLEAQSRRLAPLGWHIQVYADGPKLLEIGSLLTKPPVEVVIDHCGSVKAAPGTVHRQFQALLQLPDSGRA